MASVEALSPVGHSPLAILTLTCSLHEISLIEVLNRTTRRADDFVIVLGHFVQKNRERSSTAFADDYLLLGHFGFLRRCFTLP